MTSTLWLHFGRFSNAPLQLNMNTTRQRRFRNIRFESLERRDLLATFTVTTVNVSPAGESLSLPEAIRLANASEGPDTIEFDLPAAEREPLNPFGGPEAVFVIRLTSELPPLDDITGGTTIDGFSLVVNQGDPNPDGLEIVIDGSGLEFGTGLILATDNHTVRGLNLRGFSGDAIHVRGSGNTIQGNYIGTSPNGDAAFGNSDGIVVFSDNNLIGGSAPGEGNLVSGNASNGITIFGSDNLVASNRVGVAANGLFGVDGSILGNGNDGISISNFAFRNEVIENTIAFNSRNGVTVAVNEEGAESNSIRFNRIFQNQALGIDLTESTAFPDGVTPNDSTSLDGVLIHDTDGGANQQQNFPVVSEVQTDGVSTTIAGFLLSHASSTFAIDIYANNSTDFSGFGEGELFIGSTTVSSDATGRADFLLQFPFDVLRFGAFVTATATDAAGNTSEFSLAQTAVFETGSISGVKYRDLTGDGFSEDDLPQSDVFIELYVDNGDGTFDEIDVLATTTATDGEGRYLFSDLGRDLYYVREVLPVGSVQTAGGNFENSYYTVDLRDGDLNSSGNDFANFTEVVLGGITWVDVRGDGFDASDIPLGGVSVSLVRDNGDGILTDIDEPIATVVSTEDGAYQFSISTSGLVFVVLEPEPDAIQTFGGDRFPEVPYFAIDIGSGEPPASLDFGQFYRGTISGRVLQDQRGDGITDDDVAQSGVIVELLLDDGNQVLDEMDEVLQTTSTGENGTFAFGLLTPGTLFVRQVVPSGFTQTDGGTGDADHYIFESLSGQVIDGTDFANAAFPVLSGRVWEDTNDNGQLDDDELPLVGWTVLLTDETGQQRSTNTDESGGYSFEVLPGSYVLTEGILRGWEQTYPLARFQAGHSVPGGIVSGAALFANLIPDEPAAPELIVLNENESPINNQGTVWIYANQSDIPQAPRQVVELGAHSRPKDVIAADFDGDGDLDLAVAGIGRRRTGEGSAGSITVLRNDQGSLLVQQVLHVGEHPGEWIADGPIDLVAADFNGDGAMDLATADFRSQTVSILSGDGNGQFAFASSIASPHLAPRAVAAGDLNNDGVAELIVAYYDADQIVVMQRDASGQYLPQHQISVRDPSAVTVAELDGDQRPEIIVSGADGITILWNSEANAFQEVSAPEIDGRSHHVDVGDVNGDGTPDLLAAQPDRGEIAMLLNLGGRQFAEPRHFSPTSPTSTIPAAPQTISLDDWDGDGDLDLVTGLAVGGAAIMLNQQGTHEVTVEFGESIGGLDFGNRFAGLVDDVIALEGATLSETPDDAELDQNGDGVISPIDALLVINQLARRPMIVRGQLFDVNRDGFLSPIDVLLIINRINRQHDQDDLTRKIASAIADDHDETLDRHRMRTAKRVDEAFLTFGM